MTYATIGLIGAMKEEIELFHAHMEQASQSQIAGITFWEGSIYGKKAILCKSGVGKVNAAATTQILIDRFAVDAVIFTGVAGALDPKLNIGDIVVSTECMQHDMDVTALGFGRGVIPYQSSSIFAAEAALVRLAAETAAASFSGAVKQGRVLSGDQFIADRETVRTLHSELGGACTEMEGAAVAQVCAMNEVPYVVIRSMSDKADGSAPVNFAEFTVKASEHSYRIVEGMLKRLK